MSEVCFCVKKNIIELQNRIRDCIEVYGISAMFSIEQSTTKGFIASDIVSVR